MSSCLSADKRVKKIGVRGGVYASAQQKHIWAAVNFDQI